MWAVTVHAGGGSTGEAAQPVIAVPISLEKDAKALLVVLAAFLSNHSEAWVRDEMWAQAFPLDTGTDTWPYPPAPDDVTRDLQAVIEECE